MNGNFVEVIAPSHWASYLFNGDSSSFSYSQEDEDDLMQAVALEKKYGSPVDYREAGFVHSPDYGMPGTCFVYIFPVKA